MSSYTDIFELMGVKGKTREARILNLQKLLAASLEADQRYAYLCGGIYTPQAIQEMSKAALKASAKAKKAEAYAKKHPI